MSADSELRFRAAHSAYFTAHSMLRLPGLHRAPPVARLPDQQAPDTSHCFPRLNELVTCLRPQALSARRLPGVQALPVRRPSLHRCPLTSRRPPSGAAHLWLPKSTGWASSFCSQLPRQALPCRLLLCFCLRRITWPGSVPPNPR
ncbi:hypothetical protein NDU88_007084 [Pleurodeles waltl]|uniref:Uncharacterized protein n=1 Tax=Pleurodeles waltl TaxID=8319 RepID=A0AAV7UPN9_PLEWA|nr:hypothetical protein NDU88_007084 [Pleurodeles waltl]